ncbi:2-C-methyl-D-erythritol 4-phosphate cytidylyltransferase [Marvinbryantia formatexigens DSM 14469]|uniref:2-C-methyl-D-erythritol 4-phosphate cytidylyltransferase n=1 Tax=Marvinbryantia formatexigens DSM 14469 TaxID=478749 RepID=C6LIV4_9FIRM|nr:2-C-methyl-D-erythritol 4-phosphate cytidylyltransferase [Marvinbryantia formatexigens]EET59493.1 2-C-methyl-D-erythritol 4-phosphate cytidylyltransferase [Marvinbryantia formatexigens DSM 14469]UWO24030.1 2-C-methyl-D-erythritol 4-phosphate cytidylyltransferase [Marvinbryantia formatexigens DSM 14469]SDG66036.1 2-C-methyl-D-erythritol 4-phosphate cytidylyltransferase [Marvinbryantia formatexigens]
MKEKNVAVVLSAGQGKRMHSKMAKQYLMIEGMPVIWYSLQAFEECPFIDEVILVAGEADMAYCREQIVEKYGFRKVRRIVAGGKERYHSVYNGLLAIQEDCSYVYIHDGARPFLTQEILERAREAVLIHQACVVGMPVKDTIKICDEAGFGIQTPDRSALWQVQTPQVFSYSLIRGSYELLMEALQKGMEGTVTDDAMVVERMTDCKVKLVEGSYSNIKITTPEDLAVAGSLVLLLRAEKNRKK